jgi:hypothetical protein
MSQDPPRMPDPSSLTTQQLWREISALKELLTTRIEAVEKAVEIAHADLVRVPTEVQKAVGNLKELHHGKFEEQAALRDEKFAGVQKQLEERDVRVEQSARDTKTAVDAALAAQEKAVGKQTETFSESIGKSEAGFTKQIDQIGARITDLTKNFDEKIDGLKQRLDRGDGRGEGTATARTTQQSSNALIVAIVIGIAGFLTGVAGLAIAFLKH